MKRKTSQKALSVCQTDLVVRSSIHEEEAISQLSCFLGITSSVACACSLIVLCSLLSLSLVFVIFTFLVTWLKNS